MKPLLSRAARDVAGLVILYALACAVMAIVGWTCAGPARAAAPKPVVPEWHLIATADDGEIEIFSDTGLLQGGSGTGCHLAVSHVYGGRTISLECSRP